MEEKPTLLQLRRNYNLSSDTLITSAQLAQAARVPLADEFMMELGRPIAREIANRVISTFNILTGQHYTLADITFTPKDAASTANPPSIQKGKVRW